MIGFRYIPSTVEEYTSILDECPGSVAIEQVYPFSVYESMKKFQANPKAMRDAKH
jgi:hypothetical protein